MIRRDTGEGEKDQEVRREREREREEDRQTDRQADRHSGPISHKYTSHVETMTRSSSKASPYSAMQGIALDLDDTG